MFPDRVSNPGPLTSESGALPIAPRGLAHTGRWFCWEVTVFGGSTVDSDKAAHGFMLFADSTIFIFWCFNIKT